MPKTPTMTAPPVETIVVASAESIAPTLYRPAGGCRVVRVGPG
ncbi:MAG: hypothetical protein WB676_02150 [Bryobacteraceae bacterium]